MKKILPIILIVFSNICCLLGQPSIQWQKCLGGTGNDLAYYIQQTADHGYIIAGGSTSFDGDVTGTHGGTDCWIVKLNSAGIMQWQRSLGGTADDAASKIRPTVDGGFLVAGESNSNDGDVTGNHDSTDYWVLKLDSIGNILWEKSLGGTGTEWISDFRETSDHGFIAAGHSSSNDGDVTGNHGGIDVWLVKLDSSRNIQWQKTFGGTSADNAMAIEQTSDGGYIIAGLSYSTDGDVTGNHGDADYWILKIDSLGILQWQKSLGGSAYELAWAVHQTNDDGYIIAGTSWSNDGDVTGNHGISDYWIVKLSNSGSILWQKVLGGSGQEYGSDIQVTADGDYIVSGYAASIDGDVTGNHGNQDCWIVKLDSSGLIQWQKSFGGSSLDVAWSIAQTADGGFISAGYTWSNDGDVTGLHDSIDYWVVKLDDGTGVRESFSELSGLQIVPNPVSQSTTISFSLSQSENLSVCVYDITGRLNENLFTGNMNAGRHELKWDVLNENRIDDGVYLVNFTGNTFSQSSKLVVVK